MAAQGPAAGPEVSIEAFSPAHFDVKEWTNRQFAALSVDDVFGPAEGAGAGVGAGGGPGPEGLAQRLTTQLHFLATTAQQNSDRVKARFRHQAAQIARDIAALGRLVQETRQQIAGLAAAVDAQRASAPAVQAVVDIGTARRRIEGSMAALDHLRTYANLPQKIDALIADGELTRASELISTMDPAAERAAEAPVGLSADEVQAYRAQIEAAAVAAFGQAAAAHDVERAAQASHLLAAHGRHDAVEAELLRLCSERGVERLRLAAEDSGPAEDGGAGALLCVVLELITADRALVEAIDAQSPDAVLEEILSCYVEAALPAVQRGVSRAQQSDSTDAVAELYQTLAGLYGELLNAVSTSTLSVGDGPAAVQRLLERPIPRSLRLLFGPFAGYIGGLADHEADLIRKGSLQRLRGIEPEGGRVEPFVRDASRAVSRVFADVDQALGRIFAFVPPSRVGAAVATVVAPALDAAGYLRDRIASAVGQVGVPPAALDSVLQLGGAEGAAAPAGPAYEPLTSEPKLEAVAGCVGLVLLCGAFEAHAAALAVSVDSQWAGLVGSLAQMGFAPVADGAAPAAVEPARVLLSAFMEARSTAAEMAVVAARLAAAPAPAAAGSVVEAGAQLSRAAASAVFFLLTSAFRPPLGRIPASDAWHAVRETKSSMNIRIPQFSCSPSEEAVDIGEKMHVLLPELEQADAMHAQYARALEDPAAAPPLYTRMLECLAADRSADPPHEQPSPILAMLSLVLQAVQRNFVAQVCRIRPPMSAHGQQQLAADVDYIASIAQSFIGAAAPEFEFLQQCASGQGANDEHGTGDEQAAQLPPPEMRGKIRMLLQPPQDPPK
ncbi:hypothetical protein H4R18_000281 [Coemansia javaensis]|uniref:Conserved oligomeric Golgi complex subunit 7 n=1 Tax=Coemansia javaensis TaxID=2761396 RepID=A0A9W8HP69_9FUNG|nr:hypothetical protein H4R18_000281 [Coemansia javaensis]